MMSETTTTEAYPEAAAILAEAGWKPHDGWNVYTRDTLVMGFQPNGQAFHVKNWAAISEGHPQWTADTPDTAEEAAAWLVERFKPAPNDLTTEATLDPVALQSEEVENPRTYDEATAEYFAEYPEDESNGETGEASGDGESASELVFEPSDEGDAERVDLFDSESVPVEPLDAEFTEGEDLGSELLDVELEGDDFSELSRRADAALLDGPPPEDFAPDEIVPPETQSGAFIFGDNLDQLRTAAIGRVIRYANALMPHWAIQDDARLAYLRNFAMGVSEKRWDDDPALSAELNALETTIRRINEIKNSRDAKVEFLEGASREEIIDFAVEANWP